MTLLQQAANVTSADWSFLKPRHLQPSTNQYDSSRPPSDKGRNGCCAKEEQRGEETSRPLTPHAENPLLALLSPQSKPLRGSVRTPDHSTGPGDGFIRRGHHSRRALTTRRERLNHL